MCATFRNFTVRSARGAQVPPSLTPSRCVPARVQGCASSPFCGFCAPDDCPASSLVLVREMGGRRGVTSPCGCSRASRVRGRMPVGGGGLLGAIALGAPGEARSVDAASPPPSSVGLRTFGQGWDCKTCGAARAQRGSDARRPCLRTISGGTGGQRAKKVWAHLEIWRPSLLPNISFSSRRATCHNVCTGNGFSHPEPIRKHQHGTLCHNLSFISQEEYPPSPDLPRPQKRPLTSFPRHFVVDRQRVQCGSQAPLSP